jgi:toluene monooxygenase system protein B
MAQIPLGSSFEGDFILKLVVVDEDDTMDVIAEKAAQHTAGRTVQAGAPGILRVRRQGEDHPFDREATPRGVGLGPLECIEVYHQPGHPDDGER